MIHLCGVGEDHSGVDHGVQEEQQVTGHHVHAKFPKNVLKVKNVPERSTPQPRMEVVREKTGCVLVFLHKKRKKGTIRTERRFSADWMEMTQVVTMRGDEEVSCVEVFRRVQYGMFETSYYESD